MRRVVVALGGKTAVDGAAFSASRGGFDRVQALGSAPDNTCRGSKFTPQEARAWGAGGKGAGGRGLKWTSLRCISSRWPSPPP